MALRLRLERERGQEGELGRGKGIPLEMERVRLGLEREGGTDSGRYDPGCPVRWRRWLPLCSVTKRTRLESRLCLLGMRL